jgi:hypothetical protein
MGYPAHPTAMGEESAMPASRRLRLLATVVTWTTFTLACSMGRSLTGGEVEEATSTQDLATATASVPTETPVPPTETPIPATATVAHLVLPGEVPPEQFFLSDVQSGGTNPIGRAAAGDNFNRNRLERPFTAAGMEYRADLDIVRVEISANDTWYFFTIVLYGITGGVPGEPLEGPYAVELDLDGDGRGDLMVRAPAPPPGNWTTDGVQVWEDSNEDVGATTPMTADAGGASQDGYDALVFDQGAGEDPDAAWIRLAAIEDAGVQFAVKRTIVDDPAFLWSAWADAGVNQPGWIDYNDHFTEAQAGSLTPSSANYPLQAVAAVDNTCRMYFGYTPTGNEPGLCSVTGTVRNCSPHPMRMEPGGRILPPFFEPGSTLTDVRIGAYTFYDESVEGNPSVLTATLSPGGIITITKTGFGDVYPCQ